MEDICNITIEVRGCVDAEDLNAASPVKLDLVGILNGNTWLSAQTDQSGLIGILRHLHGMGILLLSFKVEER